MIILIVGGGPAGFFSAIAAAESNPAASVIIAEKTGQLLSKVRISGGGRCNVTHSCFEPAALVCNYPRGKQALRGPFTRFQPLDTIHWFEKRGVQLKTEEDGRMFPITDDSATIVQCLLTEARKCGVEIRTGWGVETIARIEEGFIATSSRGESITCQRLILATGSSPLGHQLAIMCGHTIVSPVPSLFTFNVPQSPLLDLAGIAVPVAHLDIIDTPLAQTGPLLITHWGFSGPAVLKLSAWGARILHDCAYRATLRVNWLPQLTQEELRHQLLQTKEQLPQRNVSTECPFDLPRNLWKRMVVLAGIEGQQRWALLSNREMHNLGEQLQRATYTIEGKSTYKEEFVTCGGITLDEINFKTMESRICPRLYFAGEVLDIDGVTGGFNFQNAWTTGWLAGQGLTI